MGHRSPRKSRRRRLQTAVRFPSTQPTAYWTGSTCWPIRLFAHSPLNVTHVHEQQCGRWVDPSASPDNARCWTVSTASSLIHTCSLQIPNRLYKLNPPLPFYSLARSSPRDRERGHHPQFISVPSPRGLDVPGSPDVSRISRCYQRRPQWQWLPAGLGGVNQLL